MMDGCEAMGALFLVTAPQASLFLFSPFAVSEPLPDPAADAYRICGRWFASNHARHDKVTG